MLNHVVLVGRLSSDPIVETSSSGKKYTIINLAVPRAFKNSSGVYETDFIRCVLWNGIASNTSNYCHKGRLQNYSYEVEDKKKYFTEVIVERVTFLTSAEKKLAE